MQMVVNKAANEAVAGQLAHYHSIQHNIKNSNQVSAGVMAKNRVITLDNAELLARSMEWKSQTEATDSCCQCQQS